MRRTALRVFYDGAGLLIFAVMIFPIYWMVTTALKPGKEILSLDPYWFPAPVTFEQAWNWLATGAEWLNVARQAAANTDYDPRRHFSLPADPPAFVEVEPCPQAH